VQTPTAKIARLPNDSLLEAELLHEMRHPLLGIKAGLELLSRSLGTELTRHDDFRLVTGQVARLEELLRSWQDLFASPLTVATSFDAELVVSRVLDLFSHRLRPLGARFSYAPQTTAKVRGIAQALLHATCNVVANALDEAERGQARVLVRLLDSGHAVEVRVSDDGSGIAETDRERIFERRFSTKALGSGLGLYIARSLMERSGGRVFVVADGDPARAPWARTELAISLPKEKP
jgi:signal transduction histidine kinase